MGSSSDPLMPAEALLPLSNTRHGAEVPLVHAPHVRLRPYSATLAVTPLKMGKHDTTATEWKETQATERSHDGYVETDTIDLIKTDT